MGFVRYGSECLIDGTTGLPNLYVSEYMPSLSESCNKVYIYGLFLCAQPDAVDNSAAALAARLGMDEAAVWDTFGQLAELGLVQILHTDPPEVRYLPIKLGSATAKKYKPSKYADFNTRLQELLAGRMITPNEYHEYYALIEEYHLEPEALLLIAGYAVRLKGDNIGYRYILTIARNWLAEGITTVEKIEKRLLELDEIGQQTGDVCKALGLRRAADGDERELYRKWTRGYGFTPETILAVASGCNKKGGFKKLDAKLSRYYESKLFTLAEIEAYESNKDSMYALARAVNRELGLYYESVDQEVDTYVTVWLGLGFDEATLLALAKACYLRGKRTLAAYNDCVQKSYRQGIVTIGAVQSQLQRQSETDGLIGEVLAAVHRDGTVYTRDRDFYRTWTYAWGFSHEIVLYAATLASGATQPMAFVNKLLSEWHAKGLTTLDACKAAAPTGTGAAPDNRMVIHTHEYTSEQLNALIDTIEDLEF